MKTFLKNPANNDRGGNVSSIQFFLVVSTCFLYLIAAGLFSKAVWYFESDKVSILDRVSLKDDQLTWQKWNKAIGGDASETGAGPGSYDIRQSVWHVNVSGRPPKSNLPLRSFLTEDVVLQSGTQWGWRLGNLQRFIRMAKLSHLWISYLVQSLLASRNHRISVVEVQRNLWSLAIDEA